MSVILQTSYCKVCDQSFKSVLSLARHVTQAHHLKTKQYYDAYLKRDEGTCECGNITSFNSLSNGYAKTCSSRCSAIQSRANLRADQAKQESFIQKISSSQRMVWSERSQDVRSSIFEKCSKTLSKKWQSLSSLERKKKFGNWIKGDPRSSKAIQKRLEWQQANQDSWKAAHITKEELYGQGNVQT